MGNTVRIRRYVWRPQRVWPFSMWRWGVTAREGPSTRHCLEKSSAGKITSGGGLAEEEKLPFLRQEIRADYESLRSNIWLLGTSGYIPKEEAVRVLEKTAALEELVCDGNYPRSGWGAARLRCDLAKLYAETGQKELMYKYLREAVQAAKESGGRPQNQIYSSVLLGTVEESALEFETSDTRPFWELLRDKWLSNAAFDACRQEREFQEILRNCGEPG